MPDDNVSEGQKTEEMISMSKYIGVKESLGKKLAKAENEVEALRTAKLQAEAKAEALEEQIESLRGQVQTPEVEKELASLRQQVKELDTYKQLALESKRKSVIEKFKLNPEKVKNLSEEQLTIIEDTLEVEASKAAKEEKGSGESKSTFDGGEGAPAPGKLSSVDLFKAGFEAKGVK